MSTTALPGGRRNPHPLDYIFHPRSIAVVGISADFPKIWIKMLYLDSLLHKGYPGQIYLVNPKGGEMEGLPIYRTLKDIPGPVDHVVVSIPAPYTPKLMEECRDIGVKVVHVFSSGYAETGEPDRIELQNRLVEIARQGNMRIIGPNCLGLYYPGGRIGLSPDFPMEPGPVGYLCQSGGNVSYGVRHAAARGLRFSKVVSYGNACDINECDLLDYFAEDPETRVIAAYIEGVKDGARLIKALNKAAAAKPVVVFKGGFTGGGLRAAASHTGSLAGTDVAWDTLIRQAGAIRVYSVEEMVDMLVALLRVHIRLLEVVQHHDGVGLGRDGGRRQVVDLQRRFGNLGGDARALGHVQLVRVLAKYGKIEGLAHSAHGALATALERRRLVAIDWLQQGNQRLDEHLGQNVVLAEAAGRNGRLEAANLAAHHAQLVHLGVYAVLAALLVLAHHLLNLRQRGIIDGHCLGHFGGLWGLCGLGRACGCLFNCFLDHLIYWLVSERARMWFLCKWVWRSVRVTEL